MYSIDSEATIDMSREERTGKVVIMGATSGIGRAIAMEFIEKGWRVGAAGRRLNALMELQAAAPVQVEICSIDVNDEKAPEKLLWLIDVIGGMDVYLNVSGIGKQNPSLDEKIEESTLETNAVGFTRMVDAAFRYFSEKGGCGQIAAITSIAGVKGLGIAPSYSATKRFQNCYLQALAQLNSIKGMHITFTDIRPGFVNTDLLNDSHSYPLMMDPQKVARKAVKAILARKRVAVIDWRYRIIVFLWKLIPNLIWEKLKIKTKK